MLNIYEVVMYMQRLHCFCNITTHSQMMAQEQAESTKEPINYGRFIYHFPPDTIKSMRRKDTYKNM